MTTFLNANLRFLTISDFERYLAALPAPSWKPIGATYHNTYKPSPASWLGHASMISMMRDTYIPKGWDRGPHLYIAVGTRFDGIYVMTEPRYPGTHAGDCNGDRFGVEFVWDGQLAPFSRGLLETGTAAIAALHKYAKRKRANIRAHRDCMPGRTCPGDRAYDQKGLITQMVDQKLSGSAAPINWSERWGPKATPTDNWHWPLPTFWMAHWEQLGRCQSDALYSVNGQVITQYFAHGYITAVGGQCVLELYPAPIVPEF